jgi:dephospho-CoA kinase
MTDDRRQIIGLTGGIATGKSTVAHYLATAYQFAIFDADIYARDAVKPGSPVLDRLYQQYGPSIRQADGTLDRPKLGQIIFSHPNERRWVEQQIHPYVRQQFVDRIAESQQFPIVLVVPLLFEAKMTDLVSHVWVVYCSPDRQLARLMQRDGLCREDAIARIEAQMPLSSKCDRADLVLDNSADSEVWMTQIQQVVCEWTCPIESAEG